MLLIMLLSTCQSPQVITVEKTVVPELAFPIFPNKAEFVERNVKERTVTVPDEWYVHIDEFRINYECLEADYNDLKERYEKEVKNEQ